VFKLCHSGVRVRKTGKKYKLRCGIEFFFICGSSVVLMRPTSVGLFKMNKLKTTVFEEEEWKTMFWVDGNREFSTLEYGRGILQLGFASCPISWSAVKYLPSDICIRLFG
jgi:hypothetical protein